MSRRAMHKSRRAASPRSTIRGARYESPLAARNASDAMVRHFSPLNRAMAMRRVWLALAEAQREAGLPISMSQIRALRAEIGNIDLARIADHERRTRHDVMAHLHAFADVAPSARPILHLGATSMDITDNADLCIMRDALRMIRDWIFNVVTGLADLSRRYRGLACLGWTHYQPAQLTTLGKRATVWTWDFVRDLEDIDRLATNLPMRGIRGATGTQASFLQLLGGSAAQVERMERGVAKRLGFEMIEPVTGQTYSRTLDGRVMAALAGVAASVHKFANDIRLLANLREVAEPFERAQVGSSAMPYKRNPMLCERATGLARFVIGLSQTAWQTAAEQWLERTLDDSSAKRVIVPEGFMATEGMVQLVVHVARGLVVYPRMIAARIDAELPFMATENVMMAASKTGGDRQLLHERLRVHSHAAAAEVYQHGRPNDLTSRLKSDPAFKGTPWKDVLDLKRHVGAAPHQVDRFLADVIAPLRRRFARIPRLEPEFQV